MAAAGFTPIQLYYSTTPTQLPLAADLASGELAVNITDGKLYYKDNTGAVKLLANNATAGGNLPGGTAGAIAYQSAPGVTTFAAIGTNGYVLTSNGSIPVYTNPASLTVGNATVATNLNAGLANQIAYQTGSSTTSFAAAPTTSGTVLGWTGSAFAWVSAPAATTAVNLTGGGAYTVVYQTSTGVTSYLANGTTGQVLTATTGGAPTWSSSVANLAGGIASQIPYQTAAGSTSFIANGTSGQVLTSNGTAAPTWTTIDALPSQTGNAGKYLTTDGTNASWAASGASAGGVIWENSTSISSNYTLTTSKNGLSVGPITIASGVTVTVPSGQRWVVL